MAPYGPRLGIIKSTSGGKRTQRIVGSTFSCLLEPQVSELQKLSDTDSKAPCVGTSNRLTFLKAAATANKVFEITYYEILGCRI